MDTLMSEEIRLDAWRAVFQKADRILSEQPVTVSLTEGEGGMRDVAGWSDGTEIFLNKTKVKEMLRTNDNLAAVLRLKGLNYHELCHVLFTPRMTDEMPKQIVKRCEETNDNRWWYAYNALEDQRIETWFTAMYGVSRRYFEATILEWIIREGNTEAAILTYGRKYLAPQIRVQAGNAFRAKYGTDLYAEFQTVIDDYITLVLPTETIKAVGLVGDYYNLLVKMQSQALGRLPTPPVDDHGTGQAPRAGRIHVKTAKRARDVAQDVIDEAIDADAVIEADMPSGIPGKGKGAGTDDPQDSEGSQGEQDQGKGSGGSGASTTGTEDHAQSEEAMRDLVKRARESMEDVRSDPKVQEDADNTLDAVGAFENDGKIEAEGQLLSRMTKREAEGHERLAVRRVTDILTRIRQEAEPETLRRQHHGRVEPRRMITRQPHEVDIFKTWDHGTEEETAMEAVVLVDVSGSMAGQIHEAAAAMWVLKRAFDKLDIRTTVLVYDTNHKVLYQPSDRADARIPVIFTGGGTEPLSALEQALRIFSKSSAPNKVLVTVTDGKWPSGSGGERTKRRNRVLKQIHALDATTMLLGLNGAVAAGGRQAHQQGHDIASVSELPKAALKLVANIMRLKALRA